MSCTSLREAARRAGFAGGKTAKASRPTGHGVAGRVKFRPYHRLEKGRKKLCNKIVINDEIAVKDS